MQEHALLNPSVGKDMQEKAAAEREFSSIFETYYKRVFNYIYYRVCCRYAAEDLTSQVFEKAMLKIDSYKKALSPFAVWLLAIARNVVNDHFRNQKKHRLFSLDTIQELVSNKKDPEGIVIQGETNDTLLKALHTLDAKERHLVALKFGGNLKNTEIAVLLDMSESNVGVSLYRTMKKLRNEMEERDSHEQRKYGK